MRSALVSGASKGIGQEIAKMLIENGYFVYALGRDFAKSNLDRNKSQQITIDFKNQKEIKALKNSIKDGELCVLVNCAGFGKFKPHEELSFEDILDMIQVNLTTPLLLCNLFLRQLKSNQGYIFNISSISGIKSAPYGAVYGASKSALRHFGTSLFDEVRKSGVKVIDISPDITKSDFFDSLHFEPDDDISTYINPKDIAQTIQFCLNSNPNITFSDITIQPQKFRIKKKSKV